jgi:hypothetical protein
MLVDLKGVSDTSPFTNAVAKWKKVITGGLPDSDVALQGSSACGAWPQSIDDLYICGIFTSIDGRSGVLGSAGPRFIRSSGTPIAGEMKFDSEDVEYINLVGVIVSDYYVYDAMIFLNVGIEHQNSHFRVVFLAICDALAARNGARGKEIRKQCCSLLHRDMFHHVRHCPNFTVFAIISSVLVRFGRPMV